jgi:hypothetical protein
LIYQQNKGIEMKYLLHSIGIGASAGIALLSPAALATTDVATKADQYGSYVILGQGPSGSNIAIARTVINSNLLCPSVQGNKKTYNMITRDNPNHFSVIVCEALVEFDIKYTLAFADGSIDLPVAKSNIKHVQVFGDTGCKTKDCAVGTPSKHFKSLADSGAKKKPDVVLHMGDYNYRGTGGQVVFSSKNGQGKLVQQGQWPYDAGDDQSQSAHCGQNIGAPYYSQSAINANKPDIWRNWHDDLFRSAGKLFKAAPWIVTRGNHELCSRAGRGYFYFLDPSSNLIDGAGQLSCPNESPEKGPIGNFIQRPSYKVSFNQLDVVVIDSANACDGFTNSPFTAVYQEVFNGLETLVSNKNSWLITHRPIWAVQGYDPDKSTGCTSANQFACVNQMMQKAVAGLPNQTLPQAIKLLFTGHMHKFESVSFVNGEHPPNIVVGSSGVSLSGDAPVGGAMVTIDNKPVKALATNMQVTKKGSVFDAYGFMDIKLDNAGGWQGELVNPAKNLTLAKCSSKQNLQWGVCELGKGVAVVAQ